jgi:hypothetical protein
MAMPRKTAQNKRRKSFTPLIHATPRMPLVNTNAAADEITMAGTRGTKTCHFHNDAQSSELKLQVRDDEGHSHQGYEGFQIFPAISHPQEIGLGLEAIRLANFPHLRA